MLEFDLVRADRLHVRAGRSEALRGLIEDSRRSPPTNLMPPFTVSYHAERAVALRRIAVSFARPVRVTAHQGADADTIVQAIGTSIWGRYDVVAFTGSYLSGEASRAKLAAINPRLQFFEHLRVEPRLRWYRQDDFAIGVQTVRISPGLRLTYQVTDRFSLESEATVERSHADSPTLSETMQRAFYFVGFRWDFEGRPQPTADRRPLVPLSQPKPPGDPVNTLGQPRSGP